MKHHRWLNFLVLLAMLLSTCGIMASAFHLAVESEPVDIPISQAGGTVEPQRYERCEYCPNGKVRYDRTEYTSWATVDFIDCPHGDASVKDWKQERAAIRYYKCDTCPYEYLRRGTETRIVCKSKY